MAIGSNGRDEERERIAKLLPWHATGQLDDAQKLDVERVLRTDPQLVETLAFIKQEAAQTVSVNEALGMPSAALLDRLVAQAAAEGGIAHRADVKDRISRWMERLFAPRDLRIAMACAAIVILLQAVFIGFMLSRHADTPGHQTAAGTQRQAGDGPQLLAVFAETATVAQVSELLVRHHAKVIDGPRADGIYRIAISRDNSSKAERDELMRALLESGFVVTALPADG
jgi:hypothetical protein